MNLDKSKSLEELEDMLLRALKNKHFDGEDYSVYEAFDRDDNRIIEKLVNEFNLEERFIDRMDDEVIKWYVLEHEISERSLPYWVFMDYIAVKAAVDSRMTLKMYTCEYLKERYEYCQICHI